MDLIKLFYTVPDIEVIELNNSSGEMVIKYIMDNVIKIKKCSNQMYWKYDIDNGILSRLQRNEKLSPELYGTMNKIRDSMWNDFDGDYMTIEQIIMMLNNNIIIKL
jgi:hypothetical protein